MSSFKKISALTNGGTIEADGNNLGVGDKLVAYRDGVDILVNFLDGIADENGRYIFGYESVGTLGVNYPKFLNAVTGQPAIITSYGSDPDPDLKIVPGGVSGDGDLLLDTSSIGRIVMNSSTPILGVIDEDNMASNSNEYVPTQQSVKAYVDATSAGLVNSVTGTFDRISVDNTDAANPIVNISTSYAGQNTITTLGTISSGSWAGSTIAIANGGTGVSSATTSPTASAFVGWDSNYNISARNFLSGYQEVATAAGTTTLVVSSVFCTRFTGTTTQNCDLPVVSTLSLGQSYEIINDSTANVTVRSSGANTVQVMEGNTKGTFKCIALTGTDETSWDIEYIFEGGGSVTSVAMTVPATSIFSVSGSPITTAGTLDLSTTGTSGGIPYFSSTSQLATSALLSANQLILGGGAGVAPSTLVAGSQYQVLVMGASNPGYGQVNIAQSSAITGVLSSANGGTGVNNGVSTLTLGGSLETSGAFASTFTMTGATAVTFPTSGTLATTAGTVSSVSGTTNRITSTGGTTPVIDISASYVGQSSIATLGTITSGVWTGTTIAVANGGTGITSFGTGVATALGQNVNGTGAISLTTSPTFVTPLLGTPTSGVMTNVTGLPLTTGVTGILPATNGGTGINNGSNTLTLAGTLATSGAFATTFTMTAPTAVTFPTSGTLATTTGTVTTATNLAGGTANDIPYQTGAGSTSFITETANGVLVYSGAGVPSSSTTLPSGLAATNLTLTTPALGTPSAGVLTSCTGLPISTGVSGLGAGIATFLATPSSANLAAAVTDETGTGSLVFGTSPRITTGMGIGQAASASGMLAITQATTYGIYIVGAPVTVVDANSQAAGIYSNPLFSPTSGAAACYNGLFQNKFSAPSAQTITGCYGVYASPNLDANVGTLTSVYGVYYAQQGSTTGTVTNSYGGYFNLPSGGTNRRALYAADLAVGVAASGVASAGSITSLSLGVGAAPTDTVNITRNAASTSGVLQYLNITPVADTGLTASTEAPVMSIDGSTRTWSAGTIALQRNIALSQPTNATSSASTITWAATLGIEGAPKAGTNATQNTSAGLLISAGSVASTGTTTAAWGAVIYCPTGAGINRPLAIPTVGTEGRGVFIGATSGLSTLILTRDTPVTAGLSTYFSLITVADTGLTATLEVPAMRVTSAVRTWNAGAIPLQREVALSQPGYAFASASTITDAATIGIAGAPIASTNATITNSHGIYVGSASVGAGVTNSYGLTINSPTGATKNYAAQFLGGVTTGVNFVNGYTTTATAAGTTTLTVTSTYGQFFTGVTTHTVALPVTSTLTLGHEFKIYNNSTDLVTVTSSGANTIQIMGASTYLIVTCISLSGTGTASWDWEYFNSRPLASTDTRIGTSVSPGSGQCVIIGYGAGPLVPTGGNNTIIGYSAGSSANSGNNTLIGYAANVSASTALGCIAIGVQASAVAQTGTTSITDGPGIAIGSSNSKVGFRGDGVPYSSNAGAGYWRMRIAGTTSYYLPLFVDRTSQVSGLMTTDASGAPLVIASGTGVLTALGQNVNGSGAISLTTSPTLVTPVLGAASATSVSFSSTSGLIGSTTNDSAAAGSVGELLSTVVLVGSPVALTTATAANIATLSLTAGDWDVWGSVWTNPAAGTTTTKVQAAISQTTATLPTTPALGGSLSVLTGITTAATEGVVLQAGETRISLSGTTNVYLVASVTFAVSTMGGYGAIYARRRR